MAINKRFASEDFVNDAASAASYLNIMDTVAVDYLEWDGETENVPNVLGMTYLISDVAPSLRDLQKGGKYTLSDGTVKEFTADDVVDPEQFDAGEGCYLIMGDSLPMLGFVVKPNASFNGTYQGQVVTAVFEQPGTYFTYDPSGVYAESLTINGYTGFNAKEVIKNQYLNIIETVGENTLTWDSEIGDRPYMDLSLIFNDIPEGGAVTVKISDSVPTINQLNMGLSLTVIQEFSEDSADVHEFVCDTFEEFEGFPGVYNNGELKSADGNDSYSLNTALVSVVTNDVTLPNGAVMEKGTYFVRIDIGVVMGGEAVGVYLYPTSVTFNGYNEFNKREAIKEEYLPDTIISKLDSIETNANNYTHPSTHPATMITQDSTHRFVTDSEKSTWNAKATTAVATTSANGLMSAAMVTKLNGIATGANAYTHPESHPATMIVEDSTHRFVTDSEKSTWDNKAGKCTSNGGEIFNLYSYNIASGNYSHAEGHITAALGSGSHAEGYSNNPLPDTITSSSTNDEIIAAWNTEKFILAKETASHAEGWDTLALSSCSHAEGNNTIASGNYSHAEGYSTIASRQYSHAEGYGTTASGSASHAEGSGTIASGQNSHAEGNNTKASGKYQHVQGKYNIEDTENKYAHIVGNGYNNFSTPDTMVCSNAHTLDWDGNAWFAGDVYVGSTSGTNKDENSKKLTAVQFVTWGADD